MNCPKCQLLEMRVNKVKDNKLYYECKNCGEKKVVDLSELEKKKK